MVLLEKILDFFLQYWVYLTLVGGCLVLLIVISAIANAKNKVRVEEPKGMPSPPSNSKPERHLEVVEAEVMNPNPVFDTPAEQTPPPEIPVARPEIPATKPAISTEKPDITVSEKTPVTESPGPTIPGSESPSEPQPEKPAPIPKKPLGKYHVMYRSDGKWYVKREGSTTVLRVLETQREAVSWAIIKALPQDIGIVVHDKDGKIKKAERL